MEKCHSERKQTIPIPGEWYTEKRIFKKSLIKKQGIIG